MNQLVVSYIKITVAMAIVGSSVVTGKLVISSFPVFLASELRFVVATVILVLLLLYKEKQFPVITYKDWFILFMQALTGVFLFNVFMLYGLQYTTAIEGGIITSTIPAVVAVIAALFLKEKLTPQMILGIFITIVGTLVIQIQTEGHQGNSGSFIGSLLLFGAVIGEALFITFGKSISDRVTPITISTMMSIFGSIMFFPFAVHEARDFDFSAVTLLDWALILYYGIFVTVVAFILMYQGLQKVPASSAGVFTGIIPISTVLLSYIILKEDFLFSHILGGMLVLFAIYLISKETAGKVQATR